MLTPPSRTQTVLVYIELALLVLAPLTWADFSGRVVGVTDGDTIKGLHDGKMSVH